MHCNPLEFSFPACTIMRQARPAQPYCLVLEQVLGLHTADLLQLPAIKERLPDRLQKCIRRECACVCVCLCVPAFALLLSGGRVTEDVIRSLAISQQLLGTEEVAIIHHTGELPGHWMLVVKLLWQQYSAKGTTPLLRRQLPEHSAHLPCPLDPPLCCSKK